jgi:hypothetical protein
MDAQQYLIQPSVQRGITELLAFLEAEIVVEQ